MSDQNPKLVGSNIIDCIPQTGQCPNGCAECYYNGAFYRTKDEPLIPAREETLGKIVRVNSGHDSNLQKERVLEVTKGYPRKFYNTSIPNFDFPAPVVFTCNGRATDYTFCHREDVGNLMHVRFRANMWNLELCDQAAEWYTFRGVPLMITVMRYYSKLAVKDSRLYEHKQHILNSYWCLGVEGHEEIRKRYEDNPLVLMCGYPSSYCRDCGHCERLYWEMVEGVR
ncbi:hypothetical protein ACFLXE_00325 [Chloroflexota bacterium]